MTADREQRVTLDGSDSRQRTKVDIGQQTEDKGDIGRKTEDKG